MGPESNNGGLKREGRGGLEADTEREGGHVKMEAERGGMLLWAQGPPRKATGCRWPPAAGKEIGSGFPSEPPEGANPPGNVTLDFWTPGQ